MFGFGDDHLDGLCIGLEKVEIITEGTVDLCHLFVTRCTKNITIIVVRHLDDSLWVLLIGQCSPTTIVWNLFNYVTETLLEIGTNSTYLDAHFDVDCTHTHTQHTHLYPVVGRYSSY